MNPPEDRKQDEPRLRAAAERQIDNAPQDEPRARPAEELLHELQVYQVELEMQNEALRQAQIALAESRDRYVDLYEFAPVGYLTLTPDGMIAEVNLTGTALLGRERKKLLQRQFTSLVIAEDQPRWVRHFLDVKQGDGKGSVELALQRGDGAVFQAQLDCVLPEDRDSPAGASALAVRIALSDVTERKVAEAQYAHLEAQLRESQKMEALGTLAGGIAHDFNNALAVISGHSELMRHDVGPAHIALESLEEINKAVRRAKDLVQQILAFGRRQTLERKPTTLSLVVLEAARLLRATLPAGMTLNVECRADTPVVLADASQVKQILLNLCANAIQAIQAIQDRAHPGVIEVRLEVHVQGEARGNLQPGRYACLTVRDNGPGMNEATRARIFEPFFTTKPMGKGTGLGLSVVHGIVKAHEASIEVTSTPGKGSEFHIYFPAVDAPLATVMAPATDTAPIDGQGKHILYIDDEEAIVSLMRRLLERQGYRVSAFTNPEEAVAAVQADSSQFDLVVTDYNMPKMSGLEVAIALRNIRADLPVVLASGHITEELRVSAPAAGIRKLIYKPDTADALCEAVAHFANAPGANSGLS